MRRGLTDAGEWALFNTKIKQNSNKQKLPCRGKTRQLATRLGRARQDRAGYHQGNINDELAQDCKHKEIIKVANEEGNEGRQVGLINQ